MKNMDYSFSKKILFGGDLYCNSNSPVVSPAVVDFFCDHDLAVLNLEAPFLDNKIKINSSQKSGPVIYQSKKSLDIIKNLHVKLVGGANNHLMDAGVDGLENTMEILSQNSIQHIGFGKYASEASRGFDFDDKKIIIIAVGEEEFGVADENMAGINSMYKDAILDQIKKNKEEHFVIVYSHGGPEKEPLPSSYIVNRYRQFIDQGAKLVVGHHPHVVQGFEEYEGGHIFYSLGNFFHEMSTQNVGALLSVEIVAGKIINFCFKPIHFRNGELSFLEDDQNFKSYLELSNNLLKDSDLFRQIHQEQAIRMYDAYYQAYFMSLFGYRFNWMSKIKLLLKKVFGGYKNKLEQMQNSSQNLLLNLIRNKSHHEFIETALKIKLGQVTDLRDIESSQLYEKLKSHIIYE